MAARLVISFVTHTFLGYIVKTGDYVEKVEGFGSEMTNLAGKTGLVVSLVTYAVEGAAQTDFTHLRA